MNRVCGILIIFLIHVSVILPLTHHLPCLVGKVQAKLDKDGKEKGRFDLPLLLPFSHRPSTNPFAYSFIYPLIHITVSSIVTKKYLNAVEVLTGT